MRNELSSGWVIEFTQNDHLYCHSLKATKHSRTFDIPCEDTPAGFVGIWPYELKLDSAEYHDLFNALREWANRQGISYRLYETRETFESNGSEHREFVQSTRN